jgi:hypothetical protein
MKMGLVIGDDNERRDNQGTGRARNENRDCEKFDQPPEPHGYAPPRNKLLPRPQMMGEDAGGETPPATRADSILRPS